MRKYLGYFFATTLAFGTAGYAAAQSNRTNDQNYNNNQTNSQTNTNRNRTSGSTEQMQDTKTKTDTGMNKMSTDKVFGKVEDYQPGKSITVSTPGKTEGNRTFDLTGKDLTARVSSSVKVGDWVSISEKTANNGHKTITVEHSKQASREQQTQEQH